MISQLDWTKVHFERPIPESAAEDNTANQREVALRCAQPETCALDIQGVATLNTCKKRTKQAHQVTIDWQVFWRLVC